MERSWEGSFNYLLPEVREHHLNLIKELFQRYDMFGLELDWMRWGMFSPPGFGLKGASVLTQFVRQVQQLADAAETRYGHPVKLAHRLPADPAACGNFGFDPVAWGEHGRLDMVTLSSFLVNPDFNPRVDLWRRPIAAAPTASTSSTNAT